MSRASIDPDLLNQMLALSDQGLSHLQIAKRVGLTRNQVLGRLQRVRAKAAAKQVLPPSASLTPPPLNQGEDKALVGLVAGNTEDRGAHLDALIWKRRTYLSQLREEGGL
jgi:hypothetical protein